MPALRMRIRIGAEHDEVVVSSPAGNVTVDRSVLTGPEKGALRRQLVHTWREASPKPKRRRKK